MRSIAIFGLGYVGLPLALIYSLYGVKVYGVDINEDYLEELRNYRTHVVENYRGRTIENILRDSIENGLFVPTSDAEMAMKNVKDIVVTVGIPIEDGKIKMDSFKEAIEKIGSNLKKGDLVLIRSTVPPGTTRDIVLPILEKKSTLKCEKDFFLAYSSERIAEGNAFEEFRTMPVAVAGINHESALMAKELLTIINQEVYEASSPEIVEIAKLFENSSRDVNIALANELASLTEQMGMDTMEIINVANTHKRVKLLSPGIGVGGHCIPYSSLYIFDKSDKLGVKLPLLHAARLVNDSRPEEVSNYIERCLKNVGKSIEKSHIAILGVAMKDNSSDVSESPTLRISDILLKKGVLVSLYDPNVKNCSFKISRDLEEAVRGADLVLIPIKQDSINIDLDVLKTLMNKDPIIFDARGILDKTEVSNKGFIYVKI